MPSVGRTKPDELEQRHADLDPNAPATIIYTSGTTGNPKGVVLTHHNVLYEAVSTLEAAGLDGVQRMVSYLPLAHIAERVLGLYGPMMTGTHAHAIGDPSELLATLGEVHPTGFFGVPRVWEKIKTGISAKLAADDNPDNVKMVQDAMAAALAWVEAQEVGGTMTPEIEEAYQQGRRGDPGLPQAAAGARPGHLGGVRGGPDADRGGPLHGRSRSEGLRRLRHDRDLRRGHGQRSQVASASALSVEPIRAWRSSWPTTARCWCAAR